MGSVTGLTWRRTALGLLVAAPPIAFVLYRTNLEEMAEALAEANYALIAAAMAAFSLAILLQALRWHYLLSNPSSVFHPVGCTPSF